MNAAPEPETGESRELVWEFAKAIDQGSRARQEDALGGWRHGDGVWFAVVADGAGGHGGGAEASAAALAAADACRGNRLPASDGRVFLIDWMRAAHDAVNREARRLDGDARTVAVAILVQGHRADWVHAGDCRLYHFRDGKLLSRTRDDSVVQVLFEQGEILEEEMGTHPDQNRLLQAIGGDEPPNPRCGSATVEPGDVFLLCSDGFWENLRADELVRLARSKGKARDTELRRAMRLAVKRGGDRADNATAMIAACGEDFGKAAGVGRLIPAHLLPWCFRVCAALVLGALVLLTMWAAWASVPALHSRIRQCWQDFGPGRIEREGMALPPQPASPVLPAPPTEGENLKPGTEDK